MKKLLFIFLSTALTSFQAQSYKFGPNVNEFEQTSSVYSLNSFNSISNNSAFIDIDFGTVADFMLFTGVGVLEHHLC
jgi:hypothetical protein